MIRYHQVNGAPDSTCLKCGEDLAKAAASPAMVLAGPIVLDYRQTRQRPTGVDLLESADMERVVDVGAVPCWP